MQILSGLNDALQLDHTKRWMDITRHIAKHTMKEINKVMKKRFQYKDMELKWVLQQLHRHRRENWKVSLNPKKAKSEKKRKGTNSRRGDVSTFVNYSIELRILSSHLFNLYRKKSNTGKDYLIYSISKIVH